MEALLRSISVRVYRIWLNKHGLGFKFLFSLSLMEEETWIDRARERGDPIPEFFIESWKKGQLIQPVTAEQKTNHTKREQQLAVILRLAETVISANEIHSRRTKVASSKPIPKRPKKAGIPFTNEEVKDMFPLGQ